jgi:hybrid cluster-associated redox disulfide protein
MIKIDSKMTIQELLEHHPCVIDAFIRLRMLCVGCPSQAYHTLDDVARIHGCPLDDLCNIIREAIQTRKESITGTQP